MSAGQSARFRDPQEEQTEALLQLFNELDALQTEQNEKEDKKETGWGWSQDQDGFDGGANGRNGSGSGGYTGNGNGRGSSDIATPITIAMVQRFSVPEPNSSERNVRGETIFNNSFEPSHYVLYPFFPDFRRSLQLWTSGIPSLLWGFGFSHGFMESNAEPGANSLISLRVGKLSAWCQQCPERPN